MLLKKQKLAERTHIGYFIGYNSSNIYRIWNVNKNKVIKTKNITFNENSCYDFTNIDLSQFISKPFIEIDLLELIQSNPIEAIEIDSNKKLKFNLHLLESKLHNNIKSLDQTMLYVSNLNTKMFTPALNTLSDSENNTITFILFNQPLAKAETVQQSNNIRPKSSNELSMNVAPRATKISASFDASSIIPEGMKHSKK